MKEISTTQKTWLQRHFPYGIAVLFLLLFAAQCVNSDRQAGVIAEQTKELEKTKKEFAQKEKDFKLLQEDLEQDSEEKQAKIDSLHKDNSNKDRLLAEARIKNKKQKDLLKNNSDYVQFLKNRYNTEAVVETNNGVELQKDIPKVVTEELIDKDLCVEENFLKDEKLKNKDSEIEQQKGLTENAITEKNGALDLVEKSKEVQKDSEELIKNQKKNIRQLNFQKGIYKIAVPLGFVLGAVGGFLLAN